MEIEQLVQPEKVHHSVYNDPEIFNLELKKIFSVAWIYVGHGSQVSDVGDFFCTKIAGQPVVMTRHKDNKIRVLYNRCAHRGAQVVSLESGKAETFRCCYHGWEYSTDGTLKALPQPGGYEGSSVGPDNSDYSMGLVPRFSEYRGFVFASLSSTGPSLEEFLGPVTKSIDDLVDRAPDGEVEVAGGIARHLYRGNWKLIYENLCDGLHPNCVHRSSIEAAQEQDDSVFSDGAGNIGIRQMRQNGVPWEFWEKQVGLWAYPHGHSLLGDYHDDEKLVAAKNDPSFNDYLLAMEAAKGKERTKEILGVTLWNTNIYPSISFMSQFRQLRVIRPLSVDKTEVFGFCFRLKGAPEKMFRDTINFANITNSVASPVLTDDLETYSRISNGLKARGNEWVTTARGMGRDISQKDGGWIAENGLSELHIRNMFDTWMSYMVA